MARLSLSGVGKSFGGQPALSDVSLDVPDGSFIAVLGPSGCGKTTMLRLVAGFETVTTGEIRLGDRIVSSASIHTPPEKRRTGIVFQSYALWPHMDVAANVAYALKVQGVPQAEREVRVRKALDLVGLSAFAARRPALLSGGQRQRVALARCLAMEPDIVLLDEPLANLDAHLRSAMEEEFAAFHRRTGATMVYITHDQAEAMALADRIAVMDRGRILQADTPRTLYREPVNEIVARFIGAGMVLPARVLGPAGKGLAEVEIRGVRARVRRAAGGRLEGSGAVCVRARDLALTQDAAALAGTVERVIYHGGSHLAEVALDGDPSLVLKVELGDPAPAARGDRVRIALTDGWLLPA
jgi:iron(III) transport system ATP-binding protein